MSGPILWLIVGGAFIGLFIFVMMVIKSLYKRCPSNKVLVIYGKVGGDSAKCMHGGGSMIIPLIQDYAYLSLEPLVIDIPLEGALSLNNIRVNVPSTFTVGISTEPTLMANAAERLLGLNQKQIQDQAQDIILGQLRLVIATLSIEEINKDREKFMNLVNENVTQEINKVGLELINVNVRDITDESGYITAIGQRAAAEAVNKARVEVAEQERDGEMGVAKASRERAVKVAEEDSLAEQGRKTAEQSQRIRLAQLEAEAVSGEAESQRTREIAVAQREAETASAMAEAAQSRRIKIATAEATARQGENESSALVAKSDAELAKTRAESSQTAETAQASARRAILEAEAEAETARLHKELVVPEEAEKRRIEIEAEAEAERERRRAKGEADAIFARYDAEARGTQAVLEAKAEGYRKMMEACAANPDIAPTLLLIEQLPTLVDAQVQAISNLKIDKITVWEGGGGANGQTSTANFLRNIVQVLPPLTDLARQAGIKLPDALGQIEEMANMSIKNPQVVDVDAIDEDEETGEAVSPGSTGNAKLAATVIGGKDD
tara:strand:+ start:6544 stop:8199 length:1656 start_codon:yes stop_codon:yes gene_type:complete